MQPWLEVDLRSIPALPTMLSDEERQYLYWLGSSVWKGEGHVVEIGPWLGGSTICLAAGMQANRVASGSQRLHVFDNFVWVDYMAQRASLPLRRGESFEPFFLENLKDYRDLIASHRTELPDEIFAHDPDTMDYVATGGILPVLDWPAHRPVEILFVDGAKSWSALRHLLITFAPALRRGSLVVCQDYKSWGTYWISALTQILKAHLDCLQVLPQNTVTFRVTNQISPGDVPAMQDVTLDKGIALIEAGSAVLLERGDSLGAAIVATGLVNFVADKRGDLEEALRFYESAVQRWPLGQDTIHLKRCRAWLEARLGRRVPYSLREKVLLIHERLRHVASMLRENFARASRKTRRLLRPKGGRTA